MTKYNKFHLIEELTEKEKKAINKLIDHICSTPIEYQKTVFARIKKITNENPWMDNIEGLDKETFLKLHPGSWAGFEDEQSDECGQLKESYYIGGLNNE